MKVVCLGKCAVDWILRLVPSAHLSVGRVHGIVAGIEQVHSLVKLAGLQVGVPSSVVLGARHQLQDGAMPVVARVLGQLVVAHVHGGKPLRNCQWYSGSLA